MKGRVCLLLSRLCSLNTIIYSFVVVQCLLFLSLERWARETKGTEGKEGRKVARPMSSSCSSPFSGKKKKKCRVQQRTRVKSKPTQTGKKTLTHKTRLCYTNKRTTGRGREGSKREGKERQREMRWWKHNETEGGESMRIRESGEGTIGEGDGCGALWKMLTPFDRESYSRFSFSLTTTSTTTHKHKHTCPVLCNTHVWMKWEILRLPNTHERGKQGHLQFCNLPCLPSHQHRNNRKARIADA